jgi:hypothetical protein
MYQLRLIHVTENALDLTAGLACDAASFGGTVVDEATCDVVTICVEYGNNGATLEFTVDLCDADG